ncbi:MAG: thioesterase [SAR86 cluster bacterium]|uniref:Thioesterase n=1 Tax=SAR86 cluster bacterium TaxID=2030880 RepID=A0A2A5BAG5_9GAMM|nr:MAG: thioesterase [SAR86 cluster bacterium]
MENKKNIIEEMNKRGPKLIGMLGGKVIDIDEEKVSCTFEFNIGNDFCHSIDIVQGGFVTAMLDAAMTHAAFVHNKEITGVSSLEIKTSYLEVTRAGKLRVEGFVIKQSYKTAFFEGRMYNEDNLLTATASSVAKLIRAPKEP